MTRIKAISISDRKGKRKDNITSSRLIENFGLENDAHGGQWHRQVSFLAQESIDTMRDKGLDVVAGNFAENITTEGVDLTALKVGAHLTLGDTELIISQLGKICHDRCAIYHQAGDCVMPREGIFGIVKKGGVIRVGDSVKLLDIISSSAAIVSTKETEKQFGEQLRKQVADTFSPAFVRYDTISKKEGGSLSAILEDLTATQKVNTIVIVDPTGGLGLTLVGTVSPQEQPNCYKKGDSLIYYCRNAEDLDRF
jgi:molybdopterin adenylyltransferase